MSPTEKTYTNHIRIVFLSCLPRFKVMARFGVVGILATIVYFVTTAVLGSTLIGLDPVLSNTLGVALSLVVSYLGHHSYTYKVRDGHQRYIARFVVINGGLFAISTTTMALARYVWHYDHLVITSLITICYPVVSYFLNSIWTFSDRHTDPSQRSI